MSPIKPVFKYRFSNTVVNFARAAPPPILSAPPELRVTRYGRTPNSTQHQILIEQRKNSSNDFCKILYLYQTIFY